jgi:hypothetical protein
MNILLAIVGLLAVTGCSPLPRTEIHVVDGTGAPLSGLPLRIEFSSGIRGYPLPRSFGSESVSNLELLTDEKGKAAVQYTFSEKQPPEWQTLVFGADRVENQWIMVTPMRDLPKGSTITVGIPNP